MHTRSILITKMFIMSTHVKTKYALVIRIWTMLKRIVHALTGIWRIAEIAILNGDIKYSYSHLNTQLETNALSTLKMLIMPDERENSTPSITASFALETVSA